MSSNGTFLRYQYAPLRPPFEFRIIILEPAIEPTHPLHVSITASDLATPEDKFKALSYPWGLPDLIYPLYYDGTEVLVTKDLDQGLRRLHYKGDGRVLWVDAVCINQEDRRKGNTDSSDDEHISQRKTARCLAWRTKERGSGNTTLSIQTVSRI
ncbi:hypothetical protein P154DRAFT_573029 [Amniculicola lignicola CBS 123094]|uniref:Heterokaryon incompatibility domain-containing protein n=1 Tax=Amniculicola lignicola CBS 123094 TaxID=1392246 RepID=A0A6A5WRM5_9PLEO|nr:hypothetical protein P154DRAFT_573029 [Amniculicola lignicola CBS 123094]